MEYLFEYEKSHDVFQIDVHDYFESRDEKTLLRLYEYGLHVKEKKKAEYEELKAKLEKMKEEYGFED